MSEQNPVSDGKVEATGSVWKIHFTGNACPEDRQVAQALTELGVVKAERIVTASTVRITPNNI